MNSSRHSKGGLVHPLEMVCKPLRHISTDYIYDPPDSDAAIMILVVVDRFTKMAHFIAITKQDSPTVALANRENVWKYHRIPQDMVSDGHGTFTGQYFSNLYNYRGICKCMSTGFHPQSNGQTE